MKTFLWLLLGGFGLSIVLAVVNIVIAALWRWEPRHPEREPWTRPSHLGGVTDAEWSALARKERQRIDVMDTARRLQAWEERER